MFANFSLGLIELETCEPGVGIVNRLIADIHDRFAVDSDRQYFGFQTATFADVAGLFLHKFLDITANEVTVGFAVTAFQVRDNTFVGCHKCAPAAERYSICFITRAIHNFVDISLFEIASRYMQAKAMFVGNRLQLLHIPGVGMKTIERTYGALGNRQPAIGNHQLRIDFQP